MNKAYLLAAVFACLVIFTFGCRLFSDQRAPARKIAVETEIGPEWKEIALDAPLEINEEIQFVGLRIENIKSHPDANRRQLLRNDGSLLEIEVELIDETGNKVELFVIGIGQYVEFGTGKRLPAGASYKKIRLRSSEKLAVREIIWGDSSSW